MDRLDSAEVVAVVDYSRILRTDLALAEEMSVVVREGVALEVVVEEYILVA
jgi:hypothetical protein